ncbi:MAG: LCP family protein [Elusimicrobia bacterium]|nr:LCP family protein [Elusimicrobiota bacterium]
MKKYLIFFVIVFFISILLTIINDLTIDIVSGKRINGIIIGTDEVDYAKHADVIIFLSYNPKTRFLDIISIPRDTRVTIKGLAIRRINQLYAYTYKNTKSHKEAANSVRDKIQEILGVEIPYYAQIDYDGFRNFIDVIGGLRIKVNYPMDYDDNWGKLHIHFSTGVHFLNGQKALEYIRYRKGDRGDLDRILRQQSFVREIMNRMKNPSVIIGFPKIAKILYRNIHTNISIWDILTVVYELKDFKLSNIRLQSLAGYPSRGSWVPSFSSIQKSVDLVMTGSVGNIKKLHTYSDVVVEIFNASGKSKRASMMRRALLKENFDVIKIGNFSRDSRYEKTVVIDRMGQLKKAQNVAAAIGAKEVITKVDESRGVDVTVIIGRDWQGLKNNIWNDR